MDSINPTLANLVGERCGQDALAIIKESDLRIAGKRLEHFCSFAGTLAAPEKAIEALWYVINSYSVVNRDFTAPDNHGWLICPPERLTATYLSIVSTSYNLSELAALGHKMQVEFGPTAPCCVNCDDLSAFLDSLNQKYQFSDILFSRQRSVFMLLNQNYKGVPGAVNYYYYSDAKLTRPHIEFYAGDTLDGIMSIISPMYAPAIILASALLQMAYIPEDGMPNAVKRTRYPRELLQLFPSNQREVSDYEIVSDIAKAFLLESPFASDALVSYVNRHLWSPIPAELAIKMLLDAVAIKYDKEEMHPNDA